MRLVRAIKRAAYIFGAGFMIRDFLDDLFVFRGASGLILQICSNQKQKLAGLFFWRLSCGHEQAQNHNPHSSPA
jgi:hypothetical protein